jgi:CRP-like cAMP-binding protein
MLRAPQVGAAVCTAGEPANCMYALRKGAVETGNGAFTMHAPMIFGEAALFSDEGMRFRQATVRGAPPAEDSQSGSRSGSPSGTRRMSREGPSRRTSFLSGSRRSSLSSVCAAEVVSFAAADVEALLGYGLQASAEHAFNNKLLESVRVGEMSVFATLNSEMRTWLVEQMLEHTFAAGEVVFKEGSDSDVVYIVKRGTASVSTKEGGKVAEVGAGKVFGESVLVGKKTKRNATVVASSEELVLLGLSGEVPRLTQCPPSHATQCPPSHAIQCPPSLTPHGTPP